VIAILLSVLVMAGLLVNGLRLRGRVPPAVPDAGASPDGDRAWITALEMTAEKATRYDAVRAVLGGPSYRAGACRVRDSFAAAGGAVTAADHLERVL
jgi:hypothetical protein